MHRPLTHCMPLHTVTGPTLPDRYVCVQVGNAPHARTTTVKKCLSPRWGGQYFTIVLLEEECRAKVPLTFRVFDEDNMSKDDFLGECDVEISALRSVEVRPHTRHHAPPGNHRPHEPPRALSLMRIAALSWHRAHALP